MSIGLCRTYTKLFGKDKVQSQSGFLWHYLSRLRLHVRVTEDLVQPTQLEVAASLGVSDLLVSDYRPRIEHELRVLSFCEVDEAEQFEMTLRKRVKTLVVRVDEKESRFTGSPHSH